MSRPWMPLYVGDYIADTAHLSAAQHGAYLLLMMHYWQKGGLPADDAALARVAKMTPAEWRKSRSTIQAFFQDGWKHKRVEFELTAAARISAAGRTGGLASGAARQRNRNDKATTVERPLNDHRNDSGNDPPTKRQALPSQLQKKEKEPELRSGADAPRDVRADLFGRGLKSLANITGKTPDSCRSLVGKWLKSVHDEAVHVLGAIDDAERNRVADPVAWINRALQSHGANGHGKRTVHDAATDLLERVRSFDEPAPGDLRDGEGQGSVRRLPSR